MFTKLLWLFIYHLGWNELLIAAFSHRSVGIKDGIILATGFVIHRYLIISSKWGKSS